VITDDTRLKMEEVEKGTTVGWKTNAKRDDYYSEKDCKKLANVHVGLESDDGKTVKPYVFLGGVEANSTRSYEPTACGHQSGGHSRPFQPRSRRSETHMSGPKNWSVMRDPCEVTLAAAAESRRLAAADSAQLPGSGATRRPTANAAQDSHARGPWFNPRCAHFVLI
jgi:hypothetical protein